MKKTPWFPADVKPSRPGMYERKYPIATSTMLDYFDGSAWFIGISDKPTKLRSSSRLPWRGLTEPA